MSNYSFGSMWLELPIENVDKIIELFLSENKVANEKKERYFHRSTLASFDMQRVSEENAEVVISFTSAGSLGDCLIDIPYKEQNQNRIKLEDVCKELEVVALAAVGEEPVEGFKEKIRYVKGQGFHYDKTDKPYRLNDEAWDEWRANMEM